MSCASLCAGVGEGTATANTSPAAALTAGSRARAAGSGLDPRDTAPDEISAFSRSRDSVGTASASARSSRQPCAAGAIVAWMMETPRFMS